MSTREDREPIMPRPVFWGLVAVITIVYSIGDGAIDVAAWVLGVGMFVVVCLLFVAFINRLTTRKRR